MKTTQFGEHIVSVERKPITEVWGQSPMCPEEGSQWRSPLKLNAFCLISCIIMTRGVGQFALKSLFCKTKIRQTFGRHGPHSPSWIRQ